MENLRRFSQNSRRLAALAEEPKSFAFDQTLAIVWKTLREFPEARLALQKALGVVLDDGKEGGDGVRIE